MVGYRARPDIRMTAVEAPADRQFPPTTNPAPENSSHGFTSQVRPPQSASQSRQPIESNSSRVAHGSPTTMPLRSEQNGVAAHDSSFASQRHVLSRVLTDSAEDQDATKRPSSAPGNKNLLNVVPKPGRPESVQPGRIPKPLLLRSKSDYGLRDEESDDHNDEDIHDWSARHGFEDHYQSEDIISQLANVCLLLIADTLFQ